MIREEKKASIKSSRDAFETGGKKVYDYNCSFFAIKKFNFCFSFSRGNKHFYVLEALNTTDGDDLKC